jgi:hypothetical protein
MEGEGEEGDEGEEGEEGEEGRGTSLVVVGGGRRRRCRQAALAMTLEDKGAGEQHRRLRE